MGAKVGGTKELQSEPNVVPLCDILLVLLIIFMVVTPMIQRGANVTLPEAVNTVDQPEASQMLTVFLQKDGTIEFDERVVDLSKLAALLEEKMEEERMTEDRKVGLRADVNTKYGRVQEVMNEIKNAGIEFIALIVDRAAGSE